MSDLVEFLRARLDDKEGLARSRLEDTASQYGACELDPDESLAEVEASRRILDDYAAALKIQAGFQEVPRETANRETLEMVCRSLATVYTDHEDYRKEWSM